MAISFNSGSQKHATQSAFMVLLLVADISNAAHGAKPLAPHGQRQVFFPQNNSGALSGHAICRRGAVLREGNLGNVAKGFNDFDASPKKWLVSPGQAGAANVNSILTPFSTAALGPTVPGPPEVTTNTSEGPCGGALG
jgi:hypothetical protein